jgi:hypothetical protein
MAYFLLFLPYFSHHSFCSEDIKISQNPTLPVPNFSLLLNHISDLMRLWFLAFILFPVFTNTSFADNGPIGARASAMGGASATLSDVWAVQNNQAGIGFLKSPVFGAYYENRFLLKQLSTSAFAAAIPVKKGAFGLTYTGFGYSAFKETKIGLAYGMALTENFSAGIQLDYLNTRIADIYGKANALTAEIGFQGKLSKKVIVAGHIYNPNRAKMTTYNNEIIPMQIRMGIQYIFSEKVFVLAEAEKSSYSKINLKGGVEYIPAKDVYIRAGGASNPAQASFGVGVNMKGLKCDISSAYHSILGFSPQIGLSFSFGKPKATEEKPE